MSEDKDTTTTNTASALMGLGLLILLFTVLGLFCAGFINAGLILVGVHILPAVAPATGYLAFLMLWAAYLVAMVPPIFLLALIRRSPKA